MAKTFTWDKNTKYEDLPKWLIKLMPPYTNLDALDEDNQMAHIRYRVQHEIDICEEEQDGYDDMTKKEYRDAVKFMASTGGRL